VEEPHLSTFHHFLSFTIKVEIPPQCLPQNLFVEAKLISIQCGKVVNPKMSVETLLIFIYIIFESFKYL